MGRLACLFGWHRWQATRVFLGSVRLDRKNIVPAYPVRVNVCKRCKREDWMRARREPNGTTERGTP